MERLLEIDGLTRRFGRSAAVDGIGFSVARGELLGFLGPNGAGKSTTMKMVAGVLPMSAGRVRVCGHDVARAAVPAQRRLGYLAEGAPLYADMTAGALLDFVARVRGLAGRAKARAIGRAVERLELQAALDRPIETLSKGFTRRVGLAQAILHDPDLLILDEPTDGLDPNQKRQVRALLTELAAERAVVVSTHVLEEVEAVCSRCVVISRGRIVADATPADLLRRSRRHGAVGLRLPASAAERVRARLAALPEVAAVERAPAGDGQTVLLALPNAAADAAGAVRRALDGTPEVAELWIERGRLDDVFHDLTRGAPAGTA